MSFSIGNLIKITIFGQSHSNKLGCIIDGLPAGFTINFAEIENFLKLRSASKNKFSTTRLEDDKFEILSGLISNKTCGTPFCACFINNNQDSNDYQILVDSPRPGHADFTAFEKYGKFWDNRGGGHFSGRMTLPLCFAGAVCAQILTNFGVKIGSHILSIGSISDEKFDAEAVSDEIFKTVSNDNFPVLNKHAKTKMLAEIESKKLADDSLGGVVECAIIGVASGIGEPIFDSVESRISQIIFAIPGCKGIEFGAGFEASKMTGYENNDEFYFSNNIVKLKTNNCGGILGGLSTGMPIIFRAAFKPTPSIHKIQNTVNLRTKKNTQIKIAGHHDACYVPRAVPAVSAAAAIAILDLIYENQAHRI